jgi:hypothetical protein
MLINSLICADCKEVMSLYELHDFYCAKSKLVLQLEERVCLQCASSIWQVVNVFAANQNLDVGRSESLEVSLSSERVVRDLTPIQIDRLIKLYFIEKVKSICINVKGHVWYDKFEIDLWESLIGLSNEIDLSKEEILSLSTISESMNIWVINPLSWVGFENQPTAFITLKAWKKLYANAPKLFKKSSNEYEPQSSS